tara:strand:+ start:1599 stop:2177 length:579 start_codon:yes stop_codon:yes gene_type:complete
MKLIFTIIISIITLFLAWLFIENQSSDGISIPEKEKITNEEMEKKLTDLTTLSKRISKKNKYLNLEQASKSDFLIEVNNINAFKKAINFNELFLDVIPGDVLNINLFGNNFQEEIKSIEIINENKIVTTFAKDNENESFLVIGKEVAFGKFHYAGKVYLLKKDPSMTYVIDTSQAELDIPQFTEEDYSLRKK